MHGGARAERGRLELTRRRGGVAGLPCPTHRDGGGGLGWWAGPLVRSCLLRALGGCARSGSGRGCWAMWRPGSGLVTCWCSSEDAACRRVSLAFVGGSLNSPSTFIGRGSARSAWWGRTRGHEASGVRVRSSRRQLIAWRVWSAGHSISQGGQPSRRLMVRGSFWNPSSLKKLIIIIVSDFSVVVGSAGSALSGRLQMF
jgi:hypothetical protein